MKPNFKTTEDRNIIVDVNGIDYEISIIFVNESGFFRVQKNSFKQLEFRDNIYNPFLSFSLVLLNNNNEIESNIFTTENRVDTTFQFNFKGNSDEFVLITLKPIIESKNIYDKDSHPFKIELPCFIKDENIFEEDGNTYKVFELIDVKYRELAYPTRTWTTNSLLNGDSTQLSNADREVFTGDAIKNILETYIGKDSINYDRWDRGSSKVFYTSNLGETPLEVIEYLIENHLSVSNNLPCFLREDKFGKINFLSIDKIFEGVGSDKVGLEVVGSFELPTTGDQDIVQIQKPVYKDISPFKSNFPINNYKFLNYTSSSILERLRSTNVVNYDFSKKRFNIFRSDGDIENSISVFNKFISKLPGTNVSIDYIPSDRVLDRSLFSTIYSTSNPNIACLEGRNELIKDLLFLSNNIEFEVQGNINLRSGKFVNIIRNTNSNSKFERKLQGYYFILDTQHIINSDKYISNVIATKPYSV